MGSQNYFQILFLGGGTIGFILWGISIATLALIITYIIQIRRTNILPPTVQLEIEDLFEQKQYREAIDLTQDEPSFLSYVVHAALADAAHGYPAMERAMEEAAEERTTKMLRNIEWLNLIGNIGPMLGLMGTVWGMIGAFFSIVEKGNVSPGDLAGDIGIALVTTLLGLAVAIPALSVYAWMRNRIDGLSSEAMMVGQQLIANFRPGGKGAQG